MFDGTRGVDVLNSKCDITIYRIERSVNGAKFKNLDFENIHPLDLRLVAPQYYLDFKFFLIKRNLNMCMSLFT